MYTICEIQTIRSRARQLKMSAPDAFFTLSARELTQICNGYGSDAWPESLRDVMSFIFRHYPEAAAIHDVRYYFSDGLEATRGAADREFLDNMIKKWEHIYSWTRWVNPVALYARLKIRAAYTGVRTGGRAAYFQSFEKRRNHER